MPRTLEKLTFAHTKIGSGLRPPNATLFSSHFLSGPEGLQEKIGCQNSKNHHGPLSGRVIGVNDARDQPQVAFARLFIVLLLLFSAACGGGV